MPRPPPKPQLLPKKRVAPAKQVDAASGSDDDDDAPEELNKDQLRALKRFKASMDDDDVEDDEGESSGLGEAEDGAGGGARSAGAEDDDGDSEEGEEDSDSGDDGDDGDKRTLEEQVADVPFEVLETLRQDGRGLVGQAARVAAARAAARSFKRQNKDRPQEVSSKRPVGRFREVIQVPHQESRDPRFDSSGPPATDTFRRRYAFVYNDMLPKEKADLQAKMKKEKNPKFKAKLQSQIQRVDTALRDENLRRRTQALESEWKTKERGAVAGGKSPFYLKASEKKRIALLAKYQELKEHGKLDKFMEKRRKKNAAKDHRYLPSGRRQQEQTDS